MKVSQRGQVWWGRWSVNGKRFQISAGTSDEKLAREILSQKYAESFRETALGEKPRRTWVEAVERYLNEHTHLKSYSSYEVHAIWWSDVLRKAGLVYLDEITPDAVKAIRDAELARPKLRGGGKRSAGDVNRKIALLRAVINAAYREYRWVDGVAPLYRFATGEKARMRCLKPDEVMRLVRALPSGYADMAMLAVATGLRRRNILRMRWDQIDFTRRLVKVDGMLMKNGETLVLPLNQTALDCLTRVRNNGSDWVFPLNGGRPLNEVSSKIWSRALAKAGLRDLRWHDLRHTWASILRQSGVPIDVLKEMGGWKDARMVERYAHLDVSHLSQHASVMDSAFAGAVGRRLVSVA